LRERIFSQDSKIQFEEITILYDIHSQIVSSLHYEEVIANEQRRYECRSLEAAQKFYLMRRVYPPRSANNNISLKTAASLGGDRLKD
jgi:hypothetical protein